MTVGKNARGVEPANHRPKPLTVFAAAFLAGAAAAVAVNRAVDVHTTRQEPIVECDQIFVAMRSLPPGSPVTVWDVALRNWPTAMLPADAMRLEDSFEGLVLTRQLDKGQPLLAGYLADNARSTAAASRIAAREPSTAPSAAIVSEPVAAPVADRTRITTSWPAPKPPADPPAIDETAAAPATGSPTDVPAKPSGEAIVAAETVAAETAETAEAVETDASVAAQENAATEEFVAAQESVAPEGFVAPEAFVASEENAGPDQTAESTQPAREQPPTRYLVVPERIAVMADEYLTGPPQPPVQQPRRPAPPAATSTPAAAVAQPQAAPPIAQPAPTTAQPAPPTTGRPPRRSGSPLRGPNATNTGSRAPRRPATSRTTGTTVAPVLDPALETVPEQELREPSLMQTLFPKMTSRIGRISDELSIIQQNRESENAAAVSRAAADGP